MDRVVQLLAVEVQPVFGRVLDVVVDLLGSRLGLAATASGHQLPEAAEVARLRVRHGVEQGLVVVRGVAVLRNQRSLRT
jgi:hypothetical protein